MAKPLTPYQQRREHARMIWQAGVDAVQPERCLRDWMEQFDFARDGFQPLTSYDRILVVGGGKAGAAMSQALETLLEQRGVDLTRVTGLVNVPNETVVPLKQIRLHPARPAGTNQPTEAGLEGTRAILDMVERARPNDLLICLISGGGSALLPAPVADVTLADKQRVTALLHRCGATIQEMNTVRKHLSRIKGGGLARHFRGARILSLIISDVIGDPLDLIASGPTCVDPTTFADALAVLNKFQLLDQVPVSVLAYLQRGAAGQEPETLKQWPLDSQSRPIIHNVIVANNQKALDAAQRHAEALGYAVNNLGPRVEGETQAIAHQLADLAFAGRQMVQQGSGIRLIATKDASGETQLRAEAWSLGPVACLSGGETTVILPEDHGLGGRNQEFVLAFLQHLGKEGMEGITVLSGGTDGEDGPTDAAGALSDAELLAAAEARGLAPADFLARHDAYHFFEPLGGLLQTGLTHTNVMDLRVILVSPLAGAAGS